MAKLTSLADLTALLPTDHLSAQLSEKQTDSKAASKLGYDGKPQMLHIVKEKRRNTVVTLVRGFQSRPGELDALTVTLKKQCGAGGRALDNEIELQGDHTAKVVSFLTAQGFTITPPKR
jgi:translation initiation factor 1 (eIF-1/SUI1)